MKYYIDLTVLGLWIGTLIASLINGEVNQTVAFIAIGVCIVHGIGTMFENDCIRYAERRQQEEEENKEEEDV